MPALQDMALSDKHGVWFPTHVQIKGGELIGYLSMAAVPTVFSWQHTTKYSPLNSTQCIGYIEGSLQNAPAICIPCDPESPYMKFLPQHGYQAYSKPVVLFFKPKG